MKVIDRICDRVAVIDHSQIAEEGRVADVFADPRSQIARELILPQERKALETTGGRRLRLIFGGADSRQPIISRLSLECQAPVNILFADTREYEGTVFGHMIVELPNEERDAERIIAWLNTNNVQWEEEKANV